MNLHRIGLYRRDDEQDYRLGHLHRLFERARIELVEAAEEHHSGLDMVLAMGGDGTVLRAMTAYPGTPVLAVNFGNVGFLTQADEGQLDSILVRLLAEDYKIEERLTLAVTHKDGAYRAINELVVKGTTNMIAVSLTVDGRKVHRARGDGVIVGTPTGSTAYLLSTGAPIIVPDVDCIVLKPLNEYAIASRSLIVAGSSKIRLQIEPDREVEIWMSVDGCDRIPVEVGDEIFVERSTVPARLVYFEDDYFFGNLRTRLGYG